jgi:LysM repeat protein
VILALAIVLAVSVTPASADTAYVTYIVQSGDTLRTIAAKYCTSWNVIYDINRDTIGDNPNVIKAGMSLTVPDYCPTGSGGVTDKGPMTYATGTYAAPYYTVAWGDNLSSIGLRFGVDWKEISAANGLKNNYIYSGEALVIPSGPVTAPPSQEGPAQRVNFASGANAATIAGTLVQGQPDSYVLWGRQGQTMTISTVSADVPLGISVGNARGDLLPITGVNGQTTNTLSTVLPEGTDYLVTVTPKAPPENPEMSYSITFTIQ